MRIVAAAVVGLTLSMALAGPVSAASGPRPENEEISKLLAALQDTPSDRPDTRRDLLAQLNRLLRSPAGVMSNLTRARPGVTATSGAFKEHEVAKPLVGGGVEIFANKGWQDTGFSLPPRQANTGWSLRAKGVWCFNTAARDFATRQADARKLNDTRFFDAPTKGRTEYPYHGEGGQVGQLIGRWGKAGQPFVVGTYANFDWVNTDGAGEGRTLWRRMNDEDNGLHDNDGSLSVTIASYDRSKRTQWNTVKKRWEYEDGTPVN